MDWFASEDPAAPISQAVEKAAAGAVLTHRESLALSHCDDLELLMAAAASRRDQFHGDLVSYSRKVFIPLSKLCRDVCHYCTFANLPSKGSRAYLTRDEVLAIARAGQAANCTEALFTLGDKPELRFRIAREELQALGHQTTLSYLAEVAELVFAETGLLPHLNPGVLTREDFEMLRPVSVSMGLMLETASPRLSEKPGPHYGSPDKHPAVRLESIENAGRAAVPFTSGILIGIGETRQERIEALLALRDSHDRYGHIQEIIIQNFRAKPDTRMASSPEPSLADHCWTIAVARLVFGAAMNIQAPPNLRAGDVDKLIAAGANDLGGISPITIDHVNPEAAWPDLDELARQMARLGRHLAARLPVYPAFIARRDAWIDRKLIAKTLDHACAAGLARTGSWVPGLSIPFDRPENRLPVRHVKTLARRMLDQAVARAVAGEELSEDQIVALFAARGEDFHWVCSAADSLRAAAIGEAVSYVVTRNINYTNVCYYRCQFCAFSKGKMSENLRGKPYDLKLEEIQARVREAWDRGATEVCLQGGIHPSYSGATYLSILKAVKAAAPEIHVHAFSPLEVWQGAATLGVPLGDFLMRLKGEGLGSLPGTAAEILDDEIRQVICPDKINTEQWLSVVEAAHRAGLKTTATIMFGHVDGPRHWARHLLRLRRLQARTGGFTEFVPLPFVPMETPIYLKGKARRGPVQREAILMHAISRLALHPVIPNIQVSWVKMGIEGVKTCLRAGANDMGGTLMNETISRSAGAAHGQEMKPRVFRSIAESIGRRPWQRTTLYAAAPDERRRAADQAVDLGCVS